uniref:THAP-type domain-containing protein n=1 Tax=Strigops habroptila TaxID=2489341 RepID=A0A672TV94_STRHB
MPQASAVGMLNCQNAITYKNSTVTSYGFPLQNKPFLQQWIHNMGRDVGTPPRHQRLCLKHSSVETDPLKMRKN